METIPNSPHPTIVEIPRWPSPTYSVWENGDFWRSKVGSRKAYSSYDFAFAAVELVLFRRKYEVVQTPAGFCLLRRKQEDNNG